MNPVRIYERQRSKQIIRHIREDPAILNCFADARGDDQRVRSRLPGKCPDSRATAGEAIQENVLSLRMYSIPGSLH